MEIMDICKSLYVEDTDEENVFEKKKKILKKNYLNLICIEKFMKNILLIIFLK